MTTFTIDDLRRVLERSSEFDDVTTLHDSVLDTPFSELGYDSLALLELAGHIQREYGVPMPDDAPQGMPTPREAVSYINAQLTRVGG